MNIKSFRKNLDFNDDRIVTEVLLETSFSKEIRILLKQGHIMKEHKAPFPIIVHVLDGEIDFGVHGNQYLLKKGDMITLTSNITHDLAALSDSIVRLTLSKLDSTERLEKIIAQ